MRSEIVDAVRAYVEDGLLRSWTRRRSRRQLYTAELPDPDLLIRTGGDQRISNFLLWQAAYAELYFCDLASGRTSARTPSTRRSPSTPGGPGVSGAEARVLRERLAIAAILVPVVVAVFLLGRPG